MKWFRVSVFYAKSDWNILLQKFLIPYLREQELNGLISDYVVFFNNEQGQNIRLAISFTKVENDDEVASFDKKIKLFLKENPSAHYLDDYIKKDFFMPYSNNTVHYNLFPIQFSYSTINFHKSLTDKILSVFSFADIDDTSVFTFTLYTLFLFTLQWQHKYGNISHTLNCFEGLLARASIDGRYLSCLTLFEENKETIIGIFDEVKKIGLDADAEGDGWANIAKEYDAMLELKNADRMTTTELFAYDKCVAEHLGISASTLLNAYCVIGLTLKEIPFLHRPGEPQ